MKKHIIKFWHQNPAVSHMYPAVLGNGLSMDWVQKEREIRNTFDKEKYDYDSTVMKCPGIFELYSRGFFVQQPYDVNFTYNRNENEIQYLHPDLEDFLGDPKNWNPTGLSGNLTFHTKRDDFLAEFPFRKDQLPYICNIKTGFRLLSPVPILFLPVPYDDQQDWSSSMGVLETSKNIEVNAQIYLNKYNGEDEKTWSVKAGDNIQFCVPLTDEKWEIQNELSIKEKMWLQAYSIVQNQTNIICPEYPEKYGNSMRRYSKILPSMKKKLTDCWKTLWDN